MNQAVFLMLAGLTALSRAGPEDSPLNLADLEGYRQALAASPDPSAPLVKFRDLWDRPGDFVGRSVSVEGRLARLFRQPRVGDFPPLAEAWIVSKMGDPICLVFPENPDTPDPGLGASIRFSGTFLKRVEYHGGDVQRMAPLIVGPRTPEVRVRLTGASASSWSSSDWTLGLGAALVFGLFLARRHLAKPWPTPRHDGPPPSFVDGEPGREGLTR